MWYHHRHCAAQNVLRLIPGPAFILRDIKITGNYVVVDDTLE